MRKRIIQRGLCFIVGFAAVQGLLALVMLLGGCGSTDPFVINSLNELKGGQVVLMDEYDALAEKHGEPKLPDAYRDDKTGAFDDLVKYLKGERPKEDK